MMRSLNRNITKQKDIGINTGISGHKLKLCLFTTCVTWGKYFSSVSLYFLSYRMVTLIVNS